MKVLLCDDSSLFRQGLALLLGSLGVEVVAALDSAEVLDPVVSETSPNVVVLDVRMPPTYTDEGLAAAVALREQHPQQAVLVLSTYVETTYTLRLLGSGARGVGYLLKDRVDDPETLVAALERLTGGETVVDPDVVSLLLRPSTRSTALDSLTPRELEVLDLVAQGRTNAGIAEVVCLSPKTVETHIASIFDKLGLVATPDANRRVLAVLTYLRARD